MLAAQVLAVKVRGVAVPVPPSTMVEGGAVVLGVVVIPVFGGELHPVVLQKRITWKKKETIVLDWLKKIKQNTF